MQHLFPFFSTDEYLIGISTHEGKDSDTVANSYPSPVILKSRDMRDERVSVGAYIKEFNTSLHNLIDLYPPPPLVIPTVKCGFYHSKAFKFI